MLCEPAAFQAELMLSPDAIVSSAGFWVPLWTLRKKMLPTGTSPTGGPPPPPPSGEVAPPHAATETRAAATIDCMRRIVTTSLPVEMHQGVSAANALHPESLIPRDVGRDVGVGDDHLRGERLVDAVAGAVEVGQQHDGPGTRGDALPCVGRSEERRG